MKKIKNIDTILFDLDGTLYFKQIPIPNANKTIKTLKENNFKISCITNSDGLPAEHYHKKLVGMGFDVTIDEVFNPVVAVLTFFKKNPNKSVYPLVSYDILPYFQDLNINDVNPDYVVIGDFSDRMSYDEINKSFRYIKSGAKILALSKTMHYYSTDGIYINTGAFVNMYENACNTEAQLLGKPSKDFFDIALNRLNSRPENTLIVGDDLTVDIAGAKAIGAQSALVKTGHYSDESLAQSSIQPDYVIDDVSHLEHLIG